MPRGRRVRPGSFRLGGLWSAPVDQEVDEELAFHLEARRRRLIEQGMEQEAAHAEALRRFGDLERVRGQCRTIGQRMEAEMHRAELRFELRQDAGYALRMLRRSPLFTVVALLTLAIGIGANTAIFSVVHAVLLRALPYRAVGELVMIWNNYDGSLDHAAIAPAEFADLQERQKAFTAISAISRQQTNLTGECGSGTCEPERVTSYAVSPNFFDVLGARPLLGRTFVAEDGREGAERVAILSHALWARRFGADSSIIGRAIEMNGRPRTVVGVMPPPVRFPDAPVGFLTERAGLWLPYSWEQSRAESRGNQYLGVLARVRPGSGVARAQQDLDAIAAGFRTEHPDRYSEDMRWRILAVPLVEQMLGDARATLILLLAAVGMVLLIACANVANLMLARGTVRRKELAIRAALGAGRGRIVRQLLTESAVLTAGGSALGVLLASVGIRALARLDAANIPRLDDVRLDGTVLAFSLAIAVLTAVLFGLAPALQQSRADSHLVMKETSRSASDTRGGRRFRASLAVVEIALALVVLVGAGLLVRSFARLQRVDTGFDGTGVMSFQLALPRARYDSAAKITAFYEQLRARVAAAHGVQEAGLVYPLPMSGDGWSGSFEVEGQPVPPGQPEPHAEYAVVMPGYFRTMRIPLRMGRDFTSQDADGAPKVVIVDEELARRHWPGESAIGKRISVTGRDDDLVTVIGVVAHVHRDGPQLSGEPQLYLPLLQNAQTMVYVVARGPGSAASLAPALRREVRQLDPDLPVSRMQSMPHLVARAVARQRLSMLLLVAFGATALLLAALGLYGVMAIAVAQRESEIGIRLALGGGPAHVLRVVVRDGMKIALAGLGLGLLVALSLSRLVSGLLFEVGATDPLTYGAIFVTLLFVALVACYIPARRATRIDPVEAMRAS
jgi:predicted permease